MTRTRITILGLVSVAVLGVAASVIGSPGSDRASDFGLITEAVAGHPGKGRGMGLWKVCHLARSDRLDNAIGFVDAFSAFTDEQAAAWDELMTALREGQSMVRSECGAIKAEGRPGTGPERLQRVERMLATVLQVVKDVRPRFEGFYSTLTPEQQQVLDRHLTRPHKGWRIRDRK